MSHTSSANDISKENVILTKNGIAENDSVVKTFISMLN